VKVLDLFSGIGGFSLGLERAGFETVAFCEPNPFCQAVLKKHWPDVPVYEDVRELSADRLANDGIVFDAICGGFPCQDISVAGKGAGLAGARSGLWWEFHRLIGETKPNWVIAENVSALRSRGLDEVLGSLAALGYDAEWHCIPASAVGAPHRRDRIWILAYPNGQQQQPMLSGRSAEGSRETASAGALDVDVTSSGDGSAWQSDVADPSRPRLERSEWLRHNAQQVAERHSSAFRSIAERSADGGRQSHPWHFEPDVGRVADGVPARLDRLKALGNAVVPQIPEIIGRVINDSAADR
jgi:DNA (cytosine-5)-methyltransferase 1